MKETFVDILGYEGLYKVSNIGRVYSTKRSTGLTHNSISRCCNGKQATYKDYVWRFVDG